MVPRSERRAQIKDTIKKSFGTKQNELTGICDLHVMLVSSACHHSLHKSPVGDALERNVKFSWRQEGPMAVSCTSEGRLPCRISMDQVQTLLDAARYGVLTAVSTNVTVF